ncbi:hypothetical protein Tco_0889143, partial [Tanacetum coccineum]
ATTTTVEGDVRLETTDDVFEATAEISDKLVYFLESSSKLMKSYRAKYEASIPKEVRNVKWQKHSCSSFSLQPPFYRLIIGHRMRDYKDIWGPHQHIKT